MARLDADPRPSTAPRAPLAAHRREALIQDVAGALLVPALVARFGTPRPGTWRRDAAALAETLADAALEEGIEALAALNPGGQMFRPICRDIILPAAGALRRRHDPSAFDQSEHLEKLWRLRMCLLSLDDDAMPDAGAPAATGSALTLTGTHDAPSVEHGVALRFFDRAGWDICDCCCEHADEACDSANDRLFDVAWISIEPGLHAEEIRATARDLRRASRNTGLLVLGGGVAGLLPEHPAAFELDGFTGSAIEAAVIAASALRLRRLGARA